MLRHFCFQKAQFMVFCFSIASSVRSHLSIPQVAHAEGLQQEHIVAVERRGPGQHFSGLGVHLVSPSHLEKSGVLFSVACARSACAALETHTHTQTGALF